MRSVKNILEQLPVERLEPATRRQLEELLSREAGDPAMLSAVRMAVQQLLQSGDLVRVSLNSQSGSRQTLHLVRGTSRLVDLGGCLPVHEGMAGPEQVPASDEEPPAVADDRSFDGLVGMLEAMEHAQDLDLDDPRSHEAGLIIERTLSLLQGSMPQILMGAQLHGLCEMPQDCNFMLPAVGGSQEAFWLAKRSPGQSFWICGAAQLPQALGQRVSTALSHDAVTAVIPLLSPWDERVEVGIVYVSARPNWSRERLLALGRRISAFVTSRWRCKQDVNRRVLTDSLTGVHNRAFYDFQAPLELERACRAGHSLTLVLGDLDHFKRVNDTHGHPCGDLVLRAVARRLLDTLRRIDHVCRIGGEEFACLLPSTSRAEAREVLARLLGRPFRVDLPPESGSATVTVSMSFGAASYPEAGSSHAELHRKADSMLYLAKKLGRDRCCLWMPDGHHELLLPTKQPDSDR